MKNLENLIKSGAVVIQLISYETKRAHGEVAGAAKALERSWYRWDIVRGLCQYDSENSVYTEVDSELSDVDEILNWFKSDDASKSILILEDFHPYMHEQQFKTIKELRNIAQSEMQDRSLILLQPTNYLPVELEKEVHIIRMELPSKEDLRMIFQQVLQNHAREDIEIKESLIEAALGLTIMEANNAFSLALIETGDLSEAQIPLIIREKEEIIKKSGFLEYYHPNETMLDIGGLDNLKDWLKKRGRAFDAGAKDYGLQPPRGIMLLGIPGTGKSLSAKAIGSEWQFPLLKLDMGKVFGGIVGESERNIRASLQLAEAISPSILWIDEIEKGLSGMDSSGSSDGGTTSRVLGTFLTWMQEKTKPVFVVATANDISKLPPELLRKGRVDEIFFVDLPNADARQDILKIHLERKNRDAKKFDLETLAQLSIGFSGAELEEAIKEAMFKAYDDGREVSTDYIKDALKQTYPLSKIMSENIKNMRNWAKYRAVMASSGESEALPNEGKDAPKLKQEKANNCFL